MKLTSPYKFPERVLVFGGGGVGKTQSVLSVASHIAQGNVHVIETDYSMAYERALATDFQDAEERTFIYQPEPEWESFCASLDEVAKNADPEHDWIAIDGISPSWDYVQDWYLSQVYGQDLTTYMVGLKAEYSDDSKGYNRALLEAMNWPMVKKEYTARVWRMIQRWKGHMILTAEAKQVNKDDEAEKMLFGPIGFRPAGEARTKYAMSSTLFLDHPDRNKWRLTTIKDRNREEQDKMDVREFAVDYLFGVAGWRKEKKE